MPNKLRTTLILMSVSGVVVAGHFLPGLDNSEIENGIRNALHVITFAVFAIVVLTSLSGLGSTVAAVVTLLIIASVGGLSEFMQLMIGKRPDPMDIVRDLFGAVLAILAWHSWRWSNVDHASSLVSAAKRAGSALVIVAIISPLLYWLSVIALSRSTFPVILSFDHWWESYLFSSINSEISVLTGDTLKSGMAGTVAEIRLSKRGRSGMSVQPMANNWSKFEFLTFPAVMVGGPDTRVTVRINDRERLHHFSDHFIADIMVTDRPKLFRIRIEEMTTESGRPMMDLSDIKEIVVFARDKRGGTVMIVGEFRLE